MTRWVVRAAVSAVVVALLLTLVPLRSVMGALSRVSIWTWVASLAIFFGGHYLNALKLGFLLGPPSPPVSSLVRAQYAGLVANLGLPGVAGGDLVRAAYLAPSAGTARVAMASVADRIIDSATLVTLIAVALPIAGAPPAVDHLLWNAGGWAAAIALVAVVAAAVVLRLRTRVSTTDRIRQVASLIRDRRGALLSAVALSMLVQSAFVLTNVWLAREAGVDAGLAPWFVAWPLSKLIAVLPISLGGIGVREAALVSILAPYGAPREAVLATGVLWQAMLAVSGVTGVVLTRFLVKPTSIAEGVGSSAGKS